MCDMYAYMIAQLHQLACMRAYTAKKSMLFCTAAESIVMRCFACSTAATAVCCVCMRGAGLHCSHMLSYRYCHLRTVTVYTVYTATAAVTAATVTTAGCQLVDGSTAKVTRQLQLLEFVRAGIACAARTSSVIITADQACSCCQLASSACCALPHLLHLQQCHLRKHLLALFCYLTGATVKSAFGAV
jgi:hypothetical protein